MSQKHRFTIFSGGFPVYIPYWSGVGPCVVACVAVVAEVALVVAQAMLGHEAELLAQVSTNWKTS